MATQSYGSAPGRRPHVASPAPRRTPKPKPLVATAACSLATAGWKSGPQKPSADFL